MRYRNVNSGAIVNVRDDKVLDAEWVSVSDPEPEPKKAPAKRSAGKSSDN